MGNMIITPERIQTPSLDRYLGCVLGGALGDALGYPVEFDSWSRIKAQYGDEGIRSPQPDRAGGKALISDDTQMSIFTIDGILTSVSNSIDWQIHSGFAQTLTKSYLKWLKAQPGYESVDVKKEMWEINCLNYDLTAVPELYSSRAPGRTCLAALMERAKNTHVHLSNHSKGCGGVMRVAPIGLYIFNDHGSAYRYGKESAAITHRHNTSSQSSGALASIIALIADGKSVRQAIRQTLTLLKNEAVSDGETAAALNRAMLLADDKQIPVRQAISELGAGWVADEALAIAVYCALKARSFTEGVTYAVNHSGDSDSTGAITGNVLGARYGYKALPCDWLENLELKDFLEHLSRILHKAATIRGIRSAGQIEDKAEFEDMYRPS